jgi:membrane protein involved in colicin uptake
MSDIQSKLAASIREAKKQQDEPQAAKAAPAKSPAAKAPAKPKAAAPARKPAAKPAKGNADKATADDPWGDLHPDRVWPD